MSLKVSAAAVRAYDALRSRPGARDPKGVAAVETRLRELIQNGCVGGHDGQSGALYVFWSEIDARVREGAFDDLLDRL